MNQLDLPKTMTLIEQTFSRVWQNQQRDDLGDRKSSYEDLVTLFKSELSQEQPLEVIEQFFRDYLKHSVNTAHPYFNNQLFSGVEWSAVLGDLLAAVTNTTMATFESSPVGTVLESMLIDKLLAKIGYNNGEGIMVGGGSQANMQAMVCARQHVLDGFNQDPSRFPGLKIFVSEHAHYSFKKAAMVMGLGVRGVVKVPVNAQNQMDAAVLDQMIQSAKASGDTPFMVAATAGTTVYGAFDQIPDLAEVCSKHNLWLHVDGAWGAPAFFSDRYSKHLLGSELADSWTWDAHKLMGATLTSSFFLSRHKNNLIQTNGLDDCKYIFHEDDAVSRDFGPMSLQCGRRVTSASLWTQWLKEGDAGFAKKVDHLDDVKKYMLDKIKQHPRFELIAEAPFLNICFRVLSDKIDCLSLFNEKIRETLKARGQFLVNYYEDKNGLLFFRFILSNSLFTKKHADSFFAFLLEVADEIEVSGL